MANEDKGTWHRVAAASEIRDNEPKHVKVNELSIALYRVDGAIHAIDDVCTHEFALLSEGYQDGDTIECPLHQAVFHIPTGEVRSAPAEENLRTYPVKIEGDDVLVLVD
ncbi:MAG: non-heme iron oxygenase ferredoxin subunit [Kiloniellaceae bacterium]